MLNSFALSVVLLCCPFLAFGSETSHAPCKCTPQDYCWPPPHTWDILNETVSGQLIKTEPLALPCYPGPQFSEPLCALIGSQWSNASFQSTSPVGLSYPIDITCPPVNVTAGETPGTCSLGTNPVYAVNATVAAHVSSAVSFARRHNIRLVIKNTGHDVLGRSDGYGGLEIWIHHLRTGITFHDSFHNSDSCTKSDWSGSAFTVGGGYTWSDVYAEAKARNVVVVGGGTPTVGCLGGWMQGGGHGPASRQFGLGADQVLEAQLILADGSIVTASPCENTDLFFALRGGGPGTYGVVVSTIIKAWPMVNATVQQLAIGSLAQDSSALLDSVTILYNAFPDLNDAGYAGYGTWSIASPGPLFANFTAGYAHGIYVFNATEQYAQATFQATLQKLTPYNNTSLFISISYITYPDFWSFYFATSGVEPQVGLDNGALGSRLFDSTAVQDTKSLRETIEVIAGTPKQFTSNNLELVSGGQVFKDAQDPYSGLNPAWRKSYFSNIVSRGWPEDASIETISAVRNDITFVKTVAMKKLAPDTGAYMNEADRLDPEYERDFYGSHYEKLLSIKRRRDPDDVFYCPTCVGSRKWREDATGKLCRKNG